MYSTKQSLSVDNMANQPKKETLWQSLFRSATNLLGEHLSRGTGSLLKNWSSMNSPLSVTVVSQDFYKSLQHEKDHQLVNPSEGFYATRMWSKESHSSDEALPNFLYDNEIISDTMKRNNSDPSDSDKRWKEYKCMYINCTGTQEEDLIKDEEIFNSQNNSNDCMDKAPESHFNVVVDDEKDLDTSTNFGNTREIEDEPVILEKPEEPTVQTQQSLEPHSESEKSIEEPIAVTKMLSNAYNKVVNGVVDLLQLNSACTEVNDESSTSSLFTKRACSPKPRSKRLHNISSGRGRGRGKSQLRKSGVSQKRHRKQRSKYDNTDDIKSDLDSWEELEYCSSNSCEDERLDDIDVVDFARFDDEDEDLKQYLKHSSSFTIADIKPKKRKQKSKNCGWTQLSVSYSVSLDEDGGLEGCNEQIHFRPRLLSDCSVDSEDSIVFEHYSCSEDSDSESEEESFEGTETETETEAETEDEDHTDTRPLTKVRFNLKPTVHPMVQWNYAYKAARKGPWEQMARDRERFRGRINCIGRVLEPVLAKKHRMRIWHERFED